MRFFISSSPSVATGHGPLARQPAGIDDAATPFPWAGLVISTLTSSAVYLGWHYRQLDALTPKDGLGHGLGIAGGLLMLAMLLYPLRKRVRWMRGWGRMKFWLRFHTLAGIVAPVMILYHCNFHLGATNSNVALFCMLMVVTSGVVGRYLYLHLHIKAKGKELNLRDLRERLGAFRQAVVRDENIDWSVIEPLQGLESLYLHEDVSGWRYLGLGWRLRAARRRAREQFLNCLTGNAGHGKRVLDADQVVKYREGMSQIERYLGAILQVVEYRLFLRWFSLWHVVHIPLMLMLMATAIVHVVAVHRY